MYTYYYTRSRKCTFDAFYGFHGAFFEKFNICCSSQQKHLLKPFSHVKPIQFRNLRRSNNNNKKCPLANSILLLTTYMHIHEGNSIFLLKDNNTGHIGKYEYYTFLFLEVGPEMSFVCCYLLPPHVFI